jgi:glycosyltransferase involved in cell wall biosynthesis
MEVGKMAPEKVCIVASAYFAVGGMSSMVRHLVRILNRRYRVIILSIKWLEEEERSYVHFDIALNSKLKILFNPWHLPTVFLYELSGAFWCFVLVLAGVKRFLVQDAVVSGFFASLLGKLFGARVFLFDYGPMLDLYDPSFTKRSTKFRRGFLNVVYAGLLRTMNKFSLRYCSGFFVYSRDVEACLLTNGLEREKMIFYNFPIDTSVFRGYDADEKKKVRRRFGISENEVVVTYIGRISEDKGLPHLLEAAEALVNKYGDRVKFLIAGYGPLEEWLIKRIKRFEGHVLFLGPLHEAGEAVDILNASDVFVYPFTVSYGYALSFLEAIAVGVPGIITDVGPTKELIVNGYNGLVVPVGDVGALTAALERLIKDDELRKYIAKNAQKVLKGFSIITYERTVLDSIS